MLSFVRTNTLNLDFTRFFQEAKFSFPYTSRKFNLLPQVKSSHVLWIAIFPTDKQIMHLPSDHVSKIYSYHFPDTQTRSTIRSSDRTFTVDRLLRRERVHFVHTCYAANSSMWTIISYSFERLYTLGTFVWSYLRKLSFLNMISRYTNGNK